MAPASYISVSHFSRCRAEALFTAINRAQAEQVHEHANVYLASKFNGKKHMACRCAWAQNNFFLQKPSLSNEVSFQCYSVPTAPERQCKKETIPLTERW